MAQNFIIQLKIEGPNMSETMALPVGSSMIGRQKGTDIHLPSPMISRRHAQLDVTDNGCTVTDLDSANGTELNGQPLAGNVPTVLNHRDVLEIGPFTVTYEQIPIAPAKPEPKPKAKPKPPAKPKSERKAKPKIKASPAPPPSFFVEPTYLPEYDKAPPGLSMDDSRYLEYLPSSYHSDFMARFLALFESILGPIEWGANNFDIFLSPRTAPVGFVPWLASWFDLEFDSTWTESQKRILLSEAHQLFARRGTKYSLSRILEIYTGEKPVIEDLQEEQDAFIFTIRLPVSEDVVDRKLIERMIDANKPAHTSYQLLFKTRSRSG